MTATDHAAVGEATNSVGRQLRALAAPIFRGEKTEVVVGRAARLAGLDYWRAFNIWYGKARRIEQSERDAIASALDKKQARAIRNELHEIKIQIARLESLLANSDPDFHSENITALRHIRGEVG